MALSQEYISCAEIWVEFVAKHFGVSGRPFLLKILFVWVQENLFGDLVKFITGHTGPIVSQCLTVTVVNISIK